MTQKDKYIKRIRKQERVIFTIDAVNGLRRHDFYEHKEHVLEHLGIVFTNLEDMMELLADEDRSSIKEIIDTLESAHANISKTKYKDW